MNDEFNLQYSRWQKVIRTHILLCNNFRKSRFKFMLHIRSVQTVAIIAKLSQAAYFETKWLSWISGDKEPSYSEIYTMCGIYGTHALFIFWQILCYYFQSRSVKITFLYHYDAILFCRQLNRFDTVFVVLVCPCFSLESTCKKSIANTMCCDIWGLALAIQYTMVVLCRFLPRGP